MTLLQVERLHGGYGAMDILHGVDLAVAPAELVVVIGPNGAGKSTLLKAIFGLVTISGGAVRLGGADLAGLATEKLVDRGLGYVPQEYNVFPNLSVQENLEMGGYSVRGDLAARIAAQFDLFPILGRRARQPAGQLSGGERQMVALARALMSAPKLLLLDEPTAGLAPKVMEEIFRHIQAINRTGVGVLMVEQNARRALQVAHRGYVLAAGRNRFSGAGADLLASR
jgi:ABC-type branched-subunit amino acid transport system ATPase component